MEALRIVQKMVWGPWLLGLFLAVGVLCMVRLRGFPIRHIRVWWGETVGSGGKGQLLDDLHRAGRRRSEREISRAWRRVGDRWSGCCVLDVGGGISGDGAGIYGGLSGNFVWGRTLCLSGKWGWKLFRWKMLCPVLRAGVAWNGMYGTGGGSGG